VVRCRWPVKKPGDQIVRYQHATITILTTR
jgi:hypothetical protein